MDDLWTEKHRPLDLDTLVLSPSIREKIRTWIADKSIPHLFLFGPVGTGKTTLAKIIINALDAVCLVLNASDERGIDAVRTRISDFAQAKAVMGKTKIIFLDEADRLTWEAQDALRNIMETYSQTTRFILSGNVEGRITDALRSRCTPIEFGTPDREEIFKRLTSILDSEEVKYDETDVKHIISAYYPDIRSMVKMLQDSSVEMADGNGKGTMCMLSLPHFTELADDIIEALCCCNHKKARELSKTREKVLIFRLLYDRIDAFPKESRGAILSLIGEHLYRHAFIPDKEINFAYFAYRVANVLKDFV